VRTKGNNNWAPLLIYFHSGSFIGGSIDYHLPILSRYAVQCESQILAVQTRLAPENKGPLAIHDAYGALKWAIEHAED